MMQQRTKKKAAESVTKGKVMTSAQVVEKAGRTKSAAKPAAKTPKGTSPTALKPTESEKPAKRGRPSKFTPAVADEICQRLSEGEPLRQICRSEHMPHWNTVYDWIEADKEFSGRVAYAREKGEEAIAQQCLEIADDSTNDMIETENGPRLNTEHVQRSKLRIETRLKLLAVWNPRKYGAKVDLNHGGQEENPIQMAAKVIVVPAKQDAAVETKPMKDGG